MAADGVNRLTTTNSNNTNRSAANSTPSTRESIEATRQRIDQLRSRITTNNQENSSGINSAMESEIAALENKFTSYQETKNPNTNAIRAGQSADGVVTSWLMDGGVEVHYNKETKQVLIKDGNKQQTIWNDPRDSNPNVRTEDGVEIKDHIGIKLSNGANLVIHIDPTENGEVEIGHVTVAKEGMLSQAGKTINGVTNGPMEFKPESYLPDEEKDGYEWLGFADGKFNVGGKVNGGTLDEDTLKAFNNYLAGGGKNNEEERAYAQHQFDHHSKEGAGLQSLLNEWINAEQTTPNPVEKKVSQQQQSQIKSQIAMNDAAINLWKGQLD